MVATSGAPSRFFERMAEVLRTYGRDFMEGNEASYAELLKLRKRESYQYLLAWDLRSARSRAEEAWHRKDYRAVIKALGPSRAHLTGSEAGKLAYAEKRVE